jgi:hypothetical protein
MLDKHIPDRIMCDKCNPSLVVSAHELEPPFLPLDHYLTTLKLTMALFTIYYAGRHAKDTEFSMH